jgi:hypothetical protein
MRQKGREKALQHGRCAEIRGDMSDGPKACGDGRRGSVIDDAIGLFNLLVEVFHIRK